MSDIERGQVTLTDSTPKMQTVQVEVWGADDVRDDCEHFEPFGLTARPADAGSDGGPDALVAVLGDADHSVVVAVADRRHRPTGLAKGNTTLYDAHGNRLDLSSTGAALNCDLVTEGFVDAATGFKTDGTAGLSGTVTITDTMTGATCALTFKGGILTNVTAVAPHTWVPAV